MGKLEDSDNYVPLSDLSTFSDRSTFDEITKQLHQPHTGGFLLESDQGQFKYVKTTALAKVIVDLARRNRTLSFGNIPLDELLQTPGADDAVVRIGSKPYRIETNPDRVLEETPDLVVTITKDDQTTGIFFKDKDVRESLNSPPPEYVCSRNPSHPNPTFGDGTCSVCPGTLSTKQ